MPHEIDGARRRIAGALFIAVALVACAGGSTSRSPVGASGVPVGANAEFVDTLQNLIGRASLRDTAGGLRISALIGQLPPGTHAIHVHERGLCSAPFTSAGEHLNPAGRTHGRRSPTGPHLGDLPNLPTADSAGVVTYAATAPGLTIASLLDADGSALIVHAAADDEVTDPHGNSGARIACAVIVRAGR